MRMFAFAKRCCKEILRDPLNLIFGLGFPVVILLLLTTIQSNVPVDLFELTRLTPGITVFGLSFMTLFSATLIAKDRESMFLQRLYTTPLKAVEYILGYTLPILPISVGQTIVCYIVALALGLHPSMEIVYAIVTILPVAIFFVVLGLLCGSVFNVKQVGGVCGALLTNLTAWLSGVWFDLTLMGKAFASVANFLPFVHAVELERAVLAGDYSMILPHLMVVVVYSIVTAFLAIVLFVRQMRK